MILFFRYPQTPHLAWLGKNELERKDKVLSASEAEEILSAPVLIEEKVDGANVGFSLSQAGEIQVQNRGQFLPRPYRGQFSRLNGWLAEREGMLKAVLGFDAILFGEWMAAKHAILYTQLPDFFLAFDVYDRSNGKFWSTYRRDELTGLINAFSVATFGRGVFTLDDLVNLLASAVSNYRDGAPEGFVIRSQDMSWLHTKGKLVRSDFLQRRQLHWRHNNLQWNGLD